MLPTLPYKTTATRNQVTAFRGLNLSENFQEGDLKDSYGITSEKYPILTQRKGRSKVYKSTNPNVDWSDPTQIWSWDGKLLVIDEGTLYYNGVQICHVSDGQKQFAVVNTKMIVWPDKIMIDLTDNTYVVLDAKVITGGGVEMTTTTITVPKIKKIYTDAKTVRCTGYVDVWTPYCWTFGTDPAAVEACFVNGAWDLTALDAIAVPTVYWKLGPSITTHQLAINDIIIPKISNNTYTNSVQATTIEGLSYPDNNIGVYGICTKAGGIQEHGSWTNIYSTSSNPGSQSYVAFFFDAYQSGLGTNVDLTDMFSVGDWIIVDDTESTDVDGIAKKITGLTSTMLTVSPAYTSVPSEELEGITIKKAFPDMDYICEKDNRLWGCSNADKTIYASCLGLPEDFYTMEGVDTDAYALAIGSEGDFTGIANYNGGMCFFKADRMIKMLGNYPSDFYMNEYRITGIQPGSNRSTIIINEVLYYKGVNGIYAYSGGQPKLISYNLGTEIYTEAVTGSDGFNLCVCMKDASGDYAVYTYNLISGFWVKESEEQILSFTNLGSKLYVLRDGGAIDNAIYCYDGGNEQVPWLAEFAPFMESTLNRRNYIRLILRCDMSANSTLTIYTKTDRGEWTQIFSRTSDNAVTFTVPIPMNRCDRFYLKLAGVGKVDVRSMAREYIGGSEHE